MSDEHLINNLRGAAPEGPPPSVANVRAAAVLGRRMRRRRQTAATLGSALTVSGFAALLTLAAPSRQSVVQGTTPAAGGSSSPPAVSGHQDPRERNLELLREALGTQNWRISYGTQGDGAQGATGLTLIPGSPTSHGLPNDAQAQIDFTVHRLGSAGTSDCGASEDWVAPEKDAACATQHDAKGRPVRLLQTWRPTTFTGAQSTEVGSTYLDYVRPDGISALITVTVSTPTTADTTTDAQQVKAWLPQFNNILVAVATDPRAENDSYVAPLPPVPADVRQCSASQLQVSVGPRQSEATGQLTVELLIHNSGSACKLRGYPGVALLNAQGKALPFAYTRKGDQMLTGAAPTTVGLTAGGTAYLGINKYRCDLGEKDTAVSIRLTLPGGTSAQTISLAPSGRDIGWCGVGDPGSKVTVTPIEPTETSLWPQPEAAP